MPKPRLLHRRPSYTYHVAMLFIDVVREFDNDPTAPSPPTLLIELAVQLRAMRIQVRDLAQPNGRDALSAVVRTMSFDKFERLVGDDKRKMGPRWASVVRRAIEILATSKITPIETTYDHG